MSRRARIAAAAWIAALLVTLLCRTSATSAQTPAQAPAQTPAQTSDSPPARAIDITIPDDFAAANQNAAGAAATLNGNPHLGGLKFKGSVEARIRKDGPVTLFLTTMISDDKVAYPDAAIHSEFEQLRTSPERGSLDDNHVDTVSWRTDLVDGGARADLHWKHLDYETETHARALAFRVKSGHLHYVQVECLHPMEWSEPRPLGALCDQILATMAIPESADADTGALTSAGIDGVAAAPGDEASAGADPGASNLPQLTLRDPGDLSDQPLPPMTIDKPKKRDYRQLLYVLGGVLLAVGFYLTTRSRNAAEAERADPDQDEAEDPDQDPDQEVVQNDEQHANKPHQSAKKQRSAASKKQRKARRKKS